MNNKECIILAGGLGTRLRSVVNDIPKCMAPVAGKPFLFYLFNQLEKYKFTHIVLALGYKSEVILEWLKTQNRSFNISYVIEEEPFGTGGAIKLAFSKIQGDQALVLNGDTYFNINIDQLIAFHTNKKADVSLALKKMNQFDRYGSVLADETDKIYQFEEKKYLDTGLINGGIYLINKTIINTNNLPSKFSFEKDVLEAQVSSLNIYGLTFEDYFIDIGIPSDYKKANIDFTNFSTISGK